MATSPEPTIESPDPAAVCACVLSLWHASLAQENMDPRLNLSESYNGMDSFMREIMRVGSLFEEWACKNVDFVEFDEVWPYLLEERFGEACLEDYRAGGLVAFDEFACLRIAIRLRLPLKFSNDIRLPVDERVPRPSDRFGFRQFRIQTVRNSADGESVEPYKLDDDPDDEEFGEPFFALYGINESGLLEHIADRPIYSEAVDLARKLGIQFRQVPGIYPQTKTE